MLELRSEAYLIATVGYDPDLGLITMPLPIVDIPLKDRVIYIGYIILPRPSTFAFTRTQNPYMYGRESRGNRLCMVSTGMFRAIKDRRLTDDGDAYCTHFSDTKKAMTK